MEATEQELHIEDLKMTIRAMREELKEAEEARDIARDQATEEEERRVEAEERLEKHDPAHVAAAVHNFLRDQRLITNPNHDVPFGTTTTDWRHALETAVADGMGES